MTTISNYMPQWLQEFLMSGDTYVWVTCKRHNEMERHGIKTETLLANPSARSHTMYTEIYVKVVRE